MAQTNPPTYPAQPSGFDMPQNNIILPREVSTPGTAIGRSAYNIGGKNGIYLDGSKGIYAGSSSFSSAPFSVDFKGNVVANNLTITGVISTGGAAADINAHATTVDGSKITNATITDSKIVGGSITGASIAASTITATNLNVSTLSAISANLGTVTAGTINGITITGGTIQTASSGQRVLLNGSGNSLDIYDSAGTLVGQVTGTVPGGGSHQLNIKNNSSNGIVGMVATASNGQVFMQDGAGDSISMISGAITITGNTNVVGTLTANGVKPFDIIHPAKKGHRLRYIAVEAPEVLVFCRGKGKTVLPQHFIDVSEPGTIQIISKGWFTWRTWIATGIRKGYIDYVNEYAGESPADYPDDRLV